MRLKNIVIVVQDLEKAKSFYKDLFGLQVVLEREGNVILTEGLVLQEASIWKDYLKMDVISRNNASVLYFEERDIDGLVKKLDVYKEKIQYVNPLTELSWGQKMVRFYDPDGNLIEVRNPG